MARRKISDAQREVVLQAYDAWDRFGPDSPSGEELAASLGVSKPTMYNIVRERERLRREARLEAGNGKNPASEEAGFETIRYLTEELVKARLRIADLERSVKDLKKGSG